MNTLDRHKPAATILHALNEETLTTLLRYLRYILKIHYAGLVHEANGSL